jgi:hypothetical protein
LQTFIVLATGYKDLVGKRHSVTKKKRFMTLTIGREEGSPGEKQDNIQGSGAARNRRFKAVPEHR